MSRHSLTRKLKVSALALALSLTISACSVTSDSGSQAITTAMAFSQLTMSQAEYQKMLAEADKDSRFPAMILLARSAIVARDYQTAAGLIANMQAEAITPMQRDESTIIEGLLYMHQAKNTDALFALNKINATALSKPVASFYYQLISNVELNLYNESRRVTHMLKAVEHKNALLSLVTPDARKTVAMQIVSNLQQLPASELTVQLNKNTDQNIKGFIDYALLDSSKSIRLKQQLARTWLGNYDDHPLAFAVKKIAEGRSVEAVETDDETIVSLKEGDRLAVLLPLTGRFAASVGEPARLGIVAALQDRNSKLKVTFYDTNRMTIAEIASALGQNGTNFIIGPILKPEVDALIESNIKLPTVVFNQPASERAQFYFFNLGPDYEGALAASKIYHDGHTRPVVIAPETTRGQRAIGGFNEVWQKASSSAAVACRFQDINNVRAALTTCPLNNADSIYINATASEVIKVRPSLPDNTPLYLTDRSYMGLNHSASEVALAGAWLGDMPWLLTDSALKSDLMATLPEADSQVQRIFAAAYDSINLSFNLNKLSRDKNDVLHGISGDLQLGDKNMIEMAPMWVQLSTSRPVQ